MFYTLAARDPSCAFLTARIKIFDRSSQRLGRRLLSFVRLCYGINLFGRHALTTVLTEITRMPLAGASFSTGMRASLLLDLTPDGRML